jgi:hypothetical protein
MHQLHFEGALRLTVRALCFFLFPFAVNGQVYINELMASNATSVVDVNGEYSDWIELHNPLDHSINISGYYVSDDLEKIDKYKLPITNALIIPANGYLILWANGNDSTGAAYLPFKLSSEKEIFILSNATGTNILDSISFQNQYADISYGRKYDGSESRVLFQPHSFGARNIELNSYNGKLDQPIFSHESGHYTSSFSLIISSNNTGSIIYYTTDGSEPIPENLTTKTYTFLNQYKENPIHSTGTFQQNTYHSAVYISPIVVNDPSANANVVSEISSTYSFVPTYLPNSPVKKIFILKAKVFKSGYLPSETISKVYFFNNENAELPVVSLQISPELFFEYRNGINVAGKDFSDWRYTNLNLNADGNSSANYKRETEIGVFFDYFENKKNVVSQQLGLKIHGGWSRALEQKAYRLYARDIYGNDRISHKFFSKSDPENYKKLLLRSSGNESRGTFIKDASIHMISRGLNVEIQDYQPSTLYINGEYWSIINLRTQIDDHHFGVKFDLPNEDFEYGKAHRLNNSSGDYEQLKSFFSSSTSRLPSNWEYIKSKIDIESFIDYTIIECFFGNLDWINNNVGYWRYKGLNPVPNSQLDGKWRWFLYDLDYGYSNEWFFERLYNNSGSYFFKNLNYHNEFKLAFTNRLCDILNTSFLPQNGQVILDSMKFQIKNEMVNKIVRWKSPNSIENWESDIEYYKNFLVDRTIKVRNDVMDRYGINGTFDLTVDMNDLNAGFVRVSSIDLKNGTLGMPNQIYPWSGKYFKSIPIKLIPVIERGYAFDYWEVNGVNTFSDTLLLNTNSNVIVKAFFKENFYSANPFPKPLNLDSCDYKLLAWPTEILAGSSPLSSAFVYMEDEEPGINSEIASLTNGSFNNTKRTRVSGLNDNGFSFINTTNGNDGYPAGKLGGFLISLNMNNMDSVTLSFKVKTLKANPRKYGIALKYRIGDKLAFEPFKDKLGNEIVYYASDVENDEGIFQDLLLKPSLKDKQYFQLFWQYFYTGQGDDGARDEISIDDITIKSRKTITGISNELNPPFASRISINSQIQQSLYITASDYILINKGFESSGTHNFLAEIRTCPLY